MSPGMREKMCEALWRTGLLRPLSLVAAYSRTSPAFPILVYHRVNDDEDPFFPALSTRVFERQMAYLARSCLVLSVEELVERMRAGRPPRNAVAITFDDGYRDTLTHAAPILARHGIPWTVFLTTGFMGGAEIPWFDRLAWALKTTRMEAVIWPSAEAISLGTLSDRLRALGRMRAHLKRLPDDELRREVDRLLRVLHVTDTKSFKGAMLTWDDVHALTGLGATIGAHTVNHPILSRVDPQRAWTEIVGSRAMIESSCGRPPKAFAYPNGGPDDYTERVKALVREAGFTCAVSTRFGVNTSRTCRWELRRGGPWEQHVPTFAAKLAWYRMVLS